MMSDKHVNTPTTAIPFSWEKIPGVPKLLATPAVVSIGELDQEVTEKALAPPPPPPPPPPPGPPPGNLRGSMKRSMSSRVFGREEDPFIAALKECSKDYKGKGDTKRRFGIWGSKSSFMWCRCSFDVEEGNLRGRETALPSSGGGLVIPREQVQSLIRMQKGLMK